MATIEFRAFTDLDAQTVQDNLAQGIQRVREDNPSLDLRRGAIHDLVSYYHAILATMLQENIADYQTARSLAAIEASPELADAAIVDDILSNFRLTRLPGENASGEITIAVSRNTTLTIAAGARFEANGKVFVADRVYQAKADAAQIISSGDRLFRLLTDGNYAFEINVVAEETGVESTLPKDTTIVPQVLPQGFVNAWATADFQAGRNIETNTDLVDKLQAGVAARTFSNRVNIIALLRQDERFSRIQAISIVGFGDAEMLRDMRSVFPIHYGGRADLIVRSEERIFRDGLVKTAVLVEKTEDNKGIWQFSLTKDDSPGFYEVSAIRLQTADNVAGTFTITEDVRGVDLTGDGILPDVVGATEAAYSRFQTAVIRFTDTTTNTLALSLGATQDYRIEVARTTLVDELQDFLGGRDITGHGGDVLVRGAAPAFTQISFTIVKRADRDAPDAVAIADAVAAAVNRTAFVGALYASAIHDVVHGFLGDGENVVDMDLFARIRRPDGTTTYLRSGEVLRVPDEPDKLVTRRTVQFYCDAEDVAVSVINGVPIDG